MRIRLAALLVAAALPLAGCGESDTASDLGADPASVVPAEAPLYVEAVVRPDGELREGAEDALKKLLRTDDPGARLEGLLDDAGEGKSVTWDSVKEWLGPRVGFYISGFSDAEPVGAAVLNVTDAGKAEEDLAKLAQESGKEDLATEIVGDFAVIGSPDGVAAVKATQEGGRPLSEVADYAEAREAVSADDDLGVAYVETQGLLDAVLGAAEGMEGNPFGDPQASGVLRELFGRAGRTAAVGFHADGDALRVDGAALGAEESPGAAAGAETLKGLPADAWLAVGFGDIGTSLTQALAQFQQLAAAAGGAAPDFDALLEGFRRRSGVDIQRDFLSWMGDGALYVRGRGLADIGGVLTIETKDAAKSRQAVGTLARGIQRAGAQVLEARVEGYDVAVEVRNPQVPVSLYVAANDERFSLGVNPQALAAVNDPGETLGDSDAYADAKATLGDLDPVAMIDTPTVISLLETFGLSGVEGYEAAKPYLEAIGPISAGGAQDGDVKRFSFAVGLR